VCHEDWLEEVESICCEYNISKKKRICTGGATFQESTINGILNLKGKISDDDIVVISFGVSPMTPQEDINDSIRVCKHHGNAIVSVDIDLCTCIKDDEFSTTQNIIRETLKGFANCVKHTSRHWKRKFWMNLNQVWKKEVFNLSWMKNVTRVPFENITVNIPCNYDNWLRQLYGDYMTPPPINKQEKHDTNFYWK
jgi:hypothetical protein